MTRAARPPAAPAGSSQPHGPRVHQVALGDVEVACTEFEGGGVPLVLVHGLTGHRDDFLPQLSPLRERHPGLRLLAPDLRGHGDSTHSGDAATFSFDRLVEDLRELLERRGIGRCHLLGHSFGGMVSLRFALAHPARVASLLLVSTAPFAPDAFTVELFERSGALGRTRGMGFLQALIERRARSSEPVRPAERQHFRWGDAYWPHHRHRYRVMEALAYQELGLAMVRQVSLEPRLGELALPVTVIVGCHDEDFLPGADCLAGAIPGAHRVDIEDAGHHPHRENPSAWLDAVSAHLARVSPAS
jgi:pimeloyl-ACP methyl ester carboxylesterase